MINYRLQQALENNWTVEVEYYEDKQFKKVNGRIGKVNINQRIIFISNKKIPLENLLEVELK